MDIDQHSLMSNSVYEHLKNLILSKELKPGEKIPETKIASQLSISRTPIREAIKRLAFDGIVNIYPNRYAEIIAHNDTWIKETGIIRISLDTIAAKLAVLHGSNYDFTKLTYYSDECKKAAEQKDQVTRIKMNCAFHLELSYISKNKQLYEMQKRLYLKLEFIQAWNSNFIETIENQYREHSQIIEALYKRDTNEVVKLIIDHEKKFHSLTEDEFSLLAGNLWQQKTPIMEA